jgi:hypothetical protein
MKIGLVFSIAALFATVTA